MQKGPRRSDGGHAFTGSKNPGARLKAGAVDPTPGPLQRYVPFFWREKAAALRWQLDFLVSAGAFCTVLRGVSVLVR